MRDELRMRLFALQYFLQQNQSPTGDKRDIGSQSLPENRIDDTLRSPSYSWDEIDDHGQLPKYHSKLEHPNDLPKYHSILDDKLR